MYVLGPTPTDSDSVGHGKSKASEILGSTPKWICHKGLSITFQAAGFKPLEDNSCLFTFLPSKSP